MAVASSVAKTETGGVIGITGAGIIGVGVTGVGVVFVVAVSPPPPPHAANASAILATINVFRVKHCFIGITLKQVNFANCITLLTAL
jgi:hypothetical protein